MTALHTSRHRPLVLFLLLVFAVVCTELVVTHLRQFTTHTLLPLAVTLDVTVGIPALYYAFIVRRYRVPVSTVAAVFLLCLYLASVILPTAHQSFLLQLKRVVLLGEPVLLLLSVFKMRHLVREYKKAQSVRIDFEHNLAASFQAVFGNPLLPLVSELTMLRYGLCFWLQLPPAASQYTFSVHRESGFSALMSTVMFVPVIEMVVVHLLVMRWIQPVALVLLLLSAYSLLFLLAHLRAVRQRPILLENTTLILRAGLVWQCSIDVSHITKVEAIRELDITRKGILNLAKPLLTQPNVLLTSHGPVIVNGLYGFSKSTHSLAFYVDRPQEFLPLLQQRIDAQA